MLLQLAATPTENVIAVAVVALASIVQGFGSVWAKRSISNQLKNGIHESIKRVEGKVDAMSGKMGRLEVQVARLDERTKKET